MVRQVKLRNRNYWAWFAKEPVGNTHGHWSEYVMHATAIACNVTFVIGSSFFFSAVPEAWGPKAGATLASAKRRRVGAETCGIRTRDQSRRVRGGRALHGDGRPLAPERPPRRR